MAVSRLEWRRDVFTLQANEIEQCWHWIRPLLVKVDGAWTPEDVRALLLSGHSQLWGARLGAEPTAIWITSTETLGKSIYGLVWIAAGEPLDEIIRLYEQHTEPWFKELGCKWIEIVGRKGWGKMLPKYQERARLFVRDL